MNSTRKLTQTIRRAVSTKNATTAFQNSVREKASQTNFSQGLTSDMLELIRQSEDGYGGKVTVMATDPVQGLIAFGTIQGFICVIGKDNRTQRILRLPSKQNVKFLTFDINRGKLISIDAKDKLYIWNLETCKLVMSFMCSLPSLPRTQSGISSIHLPFESPWLFLGLENGTVSMVNVREYEISNYYIPSCASSAMSIVTSIKQHPEDAAYILISYAEGHLALYDVYESKIIRQYTLRNPSMVLTVCWHSSGKYFVSGHANGVLAFWEISNSSPMLVRTVYDDKREEGEVKNPVDKIQWITQPNNSESILIISNGGIKEEMKHVCVMQISSIQPFQVKSLQNISVEEKIYTFETLSTSPWQLGAEALIISSARGITAYDLKKPGLAEIEIPCALSLIVSPIVSIQYQTQCANYLFEALRKIPTSNPKLQPWPFKGGSHGITPEFISDDLLITCHENGLIQFWDSSKATLELISKINVLEYIKSSKTLEGSYLEQLNQTIANRVPCAGFKFDSKSLMLVVHFSDGLFVALKWKDGKPAAGEEERKTSATSATSAATTATDSSSSIDKPTENISGVSKDSFSTATTPNSNSNSNNNNNNQSNTGNNGNGNGNTSNPPAASAGNSKTDAVSPKIEIARSPTAESSNKNPFEEPNSVETPVKRNASDVSLPSIVHTTQTFKVVKSGYNLFFISRFNNAAITNIRIAVEWDLMAVTDATGALYMISLKTGEIIFSKIFTTPSKSSKSKGTKAERVDISSIRFAYTYINSSDTKMYCVLLVTTRCGGLYVYIIFSIGTSLEFRQECFMEGIGGGEEKPLIDCLIVDDRGAKVTSEFGEWPPMESPHGASSVTASPSTASLALASTTGGTSAATTPTSSAPTSSSSMGERRKSLKTLGEEPTALFFTDTNESSMTISQPVSQTAVGSKVVHPTHFLILCYPQELQVHANMSLDDNIAKAGLKDPAVTSEETSTAPTEMKDYFVKMQLIFMGFSVLSCLTAYGHLLIYSLPNLNLLKQFNDVALNQKLWRLRQTAVSQDARMVFLTSDYLMERQSLLAYENILGLPEAYSSLFTKRFPSPQKPTSTWSKLIGFMNRTMEDIEPIFAESVASLDPKVAPKPGTRVAKSQETMVAERKELLGNKAPGEGLTKTTDVTKKNAEMSRVMNENVQKLSERGDKLSELGEKTDALHNEATNFYEAARRLRMQQENKKWYQFW